MKFWQNYTLFNFLHSKALSIYEQIINRQLAQIQKKSYLCAR